MWPVLADGDGVVTRRVDNTDLLQVGDVVVAQHPFQADLVLVKRIDTIENGRFHLLGDQPAESTDSRGLGWFGPELIRGRVIARVPKSAP